MTESHEKQIDDAIDRLAFWNDMEADEAAQAVVEDEDDNPEWKQHIADTSLLLSEVKSLRKQLAEFTAKEGPLNAECWTLDKLLESLEKWKQIASGKTCISVENLCYGASSLWHQTHRENFRKVNRKPKALSEWVLQNYGSVRSDFPKQVLEILEKQKEYNIRFAMYDDMTPITDEWLAEIFPCHSINGYSLVIDAQVAGADPVQLFILEDIDSPGMFTATLQQSYLEDIVSITGRKFRVRGYVQMLLSVLGYQRPDQASNGKAE